MADNRSDRPAEPRPASLVLYCIVRRQERLGAAVQVALISKQGQPTFPPTKFRPGEDLYHAMARVMEGDLGLPPGSYFPEEELPAMQNAGQSPRYPGLAREWHLYPVVVSLTAEGAGRLAGSGQVMWWTIEQILAEAKEPNVLKIGQFLREQRGDLLEGVAAAPSMDALACQWAASHDGGVRVVRREDIGRILSAGSRAFNLRVADPYLPYQKQGLGFTWSFFTPRDKQDVHVHGMPAVEIYGVLEGRLQLWHKPMNQRGVLMWQCQTLEAGDWAEVEALHCHLACWLTEEGLGTVIKAAATGELAGVGRLGVAGKTTCQWTTPTGGRDHCSSFGQCQFPPAMRVLMAEYAKAYEERDYEAIAKAGEGADLAVRTRSREVSP